MSAKTNANSEPTELLVITGKEFRRATYRVLAQFVAVGLAALVFQSDLERLLGGYRDAAGLIVAALILITNNVYLVRRASRRVHFSERIVLMVESHLRLDEAIGIQLKEVVGDTENAAMMLIMELAKLSDEAKAVESILSLQEGHSEQHYKQLSTVMTEYNTRLAAGFAEIFGHVQFQDVVRQRIERIEDAVAKRNALFQAFAREMDMPEVDLLELHLQMRGVLDEYLSIESCHAPASNNASGQDASLPKFELF